MVSISILVVFIFIFIVFSQTTLSRGQYEESQAIKTFQNAYGDVYDCVDIYKQPSLNHPLLKNHKIQMRPTSSSKHLKPIQKGFKNTCSRGTVPIRRLSSTQHSITSNDRDPMAFAGIVTTNSDRYYGVSTIVSVYKPTIKEDQMSGVRVTLQRDTDIVEAGWMVNPVLYGDMNTRLYTSWTADGEGCYNTDCPGFIVVNSKTPVDLVFNETTVSVSKRVQVDLQIFQDKANGNWWFAYGRKDEVIGYWPKEIVPYLANGADKVKMGGMVRSFKQPYIDPPMGSGKNFRRWIFYNTWNYYNTAFFAQIQFINKTHLPFHGDDAFLGKLWNRNCFLSIDSSYKDYKIKGFNYIFGYSFAFGGEGGDASKCKPVIDRS